MGYRAIYRDAYNEIDAWRAEVRQTQTSDDIIRALEERIERTSDPATLAVLTLFLAQEHFARGDPVAAEAARRRDPVYAIHCWYNEWDRHTPDLDIIPALEERIRNESEPGKLHILRHYLYTEHWQRRDHPAAEAVLLADIAADPDDPSSLIWLAEQKFRLEGDPLAAMRIVDRAVAVAMRAGVSRQHALRTKAGIALELEAYPIVEDVLRHIMALTADLPGDPDIAPERDILDHLPPGSIDADVARAYDEYCRAHGSLPSADRQYIDALVVRFARPHWCKVTRVMADVLDECERNHVDENVIAVMHSVRHMIKCDKLEARGDLSAWQYDVRLARSSGDE